MNMTKLSTHLCLGALCSFSDGKVPVCPQSTRDPHLHYLVGLTFTLNALFLLRTLAGTQPAVHGKVLRAK